MLITKNAAGRIAIDTDLRGWGRRISDWLSRSRHTWRQMTADTNMEL